MAIIDRLSFTTGIATIRTDTWGLSIGPPKVKLPSNTIIARIREIIL